MCGPVKTLKHLVILTQTTTEHKTIMSQQLKYQPTLPSALADAHLVLAETSFRVSAVGHAVGDVARRPLPVGFTLTVH